MTVAQLDRRARRAADGRWKERLARLGLAAKGVSYGIVAVLAVLVALGERSKGEATDRQGALEKIAGNAFGKLLLILLAVGFAAYVAWRLIEAFVGERDEEGAKRWAKRAAHLGKAAIYGALLATTISVLVGSGGSGSHDEQRKTAWLLDMPGGRWLVGAIGLAIGGAALFNAWRAASGKFMDKLDRSRLGSTAEETACLLGRIGLGARAIVFGMIAVFVVRAAIQYDPQEAIGLDGALRKLADGAFGGALLGLVAAGLLAYALWSLAEARWREI